MKIFFASYRNDYTNKWETTRRIYSASYFLFYEPLRKFAEKYGHIVQTFWVDEVILEYGRDRVNQILLEEMISSGSDVFFFYGTEYDFDKKILKKMKDTIGTPTIYFCGDDSWSLDSISRHFAPYFKWIVTWCSGAVEKYKKLGCTNVISSQVWVDTDSYRPTSDKKDIDVSFIGTWNRQRGKTIEKLCKSNISVFVRGNGWPDGPVLQEEMINLITRSKISLSLNSPSFYLGPRSIARLFVRRAYLGEGGLPIKFDAHHLFRNARAWFQKNILQIKGRTFEIPACRTMTMTKPADNIEEYYVPNKEMIFYKNDGDLIERIRYYLIHDKEREEIARRGYERTIKEHTFEKRILHIFSIIGLVK
jgi:spore maturation protein CgeB